ncbi:delta-60 repeat domain-containing protein/Por secretion system C-terminal sorting domain-containing protein [Flexibacter flexilis DSM 6793]|uniref:Delta-60 repeat domain-containing protein/Por secretion system C-terminal sorting domain-containing protein n=1 Tax=Flexibacter flexilis DSM 6793 TaxID=927664 RepID=A0A1I1KC05_9BACT|nr:T9SS type A sorting domain-containing protein [Flexibacter flexilis]SFC55613.1 delta-60 repeat domain-containing protein/Por secretion system C-terminal sorting domain-containing protein [Flexibacter flexilis DSM 6793]
MKRINILFLLLVLIFNQTKSFGQNNDGALDPTFTSMANEQVNAIAELSDGKYIIIGKFTQYDGIARNGVARLNADGTLDQNFTVGTGANAEVKCVLVQPDGKILIGGFFTQYNGVAVSRMIRLNADGTLDATNMQTMANGDVYTMTRQTDGKYLVGGNFTTFNGVTRNRITRLNADLSTDTSFAPIGAGASIYTITQQTDGKILIGGLFEFFNGVAHSKIARLNADGSLDNTFLAQLQTGSSYYITKIALQSTGKIIITGSFYNVNGSNDKLYITRLRASDGLNDDTFNNIFLGTGSNHGTNSFINNAIVTSDDKIIITGPFTVYNTVIRNGLARVTAEGLLDDTFFPGSSSLGFMTPIGLNAQGMGLSYNSTTKKLMVVGQFTSYHLTTTNVNRVIRVKMNDCTNTNITTQPTSQAACLGGSVTLSVAATGSNLAYQWKKGTTNIGTGATLTLNNLTAAQFGTDYSVDITGGCGTVTSNTFAITQMPETVISTQPTSQAACLGGSVTLSAVATGSNLAYEWQKGTSNVGTGATLTLNNLVANQFGTDYRVIVTGICGSVTSNTFAVTQNAATDISTQPTSQAACLGGSVTLSVAATGSNLAYQWKKGTTNIGTGATLTLNNLTAAQFGTDYSVVVTGGCGSPITSNTFAVTQNAATAISTHPTSQAACLGSSVTLSVAATGSNLSYQWKKGATNIGTGATLTLNNLTAAQFGTDYSVVVTGGCGSPITSNTFAVTQNAATAISTQPTSQAACLGGSVTLSVAATGSNLSYQWKKGATNIGTGATLTLNNLTAAQFGTDYSVVVTGGCGSPITSNTFAVTQNAATAISTQPTSQAACLGGSVTLSVAATGSNLSYQWKKGATNIGTGATLTLNNLTAAQFGTDYSVVVTGGCGSPITSNTFAVTQNAATAISTQPTSQAACLGSSVTLSVAATGSNLAYQWKKGTTNIGTGATLTLNNLTAAQFGTDYSVVVTGGCGTVTSNTFALTKKDTFQTVLNINLPVGQIYNFGSQVLSQAGMYSLTLPASNGCDSTVILHLSYITGIDDQLATNAAISAYPNPSKGKVFWNIAEGKTAQIQVFNLQRKLLVAQSVSTNNNTLDLSALASGVYVARVREGNRQYNLRIVKE